MDPFPFLAEHLLIVALCECVATEGTCVCRGDPHCYSFDATKYAMEDELFLTGSCQFVMVQDECYPSMSSPSFKVIANFQRVKRHLMRSYVSDLRIEFIAAGPVSVVGLWMVCLLC